MPGTHEDLFALLAIITNPDEVKANLTKLDTATKAAAEERKQSVAAREEAAANNVSAQKALANANKANTEATEARRLAQGQKDKSDIALSEAKELSEKLREQTNDLNRREAAIASKEAAIKAQSEALDAGEAKVAAMQKELSAKLSKLKDIAA